MEIVKAVISLNERRWPEMWGYVQRAHKILQKTASAPSGHDDLRADATTFFILCYNLVDWIGNDPMIKLELAEIHSEIRKSEAMSICADFANTSKHFLRSRGTEASVGEVTVLTGSGGHSTSGIIKYERDGQQKEADLLTVANDCLSWWESYLKNQKLL